jgi:hypothetical protein
MVEPVSWCRARRCKRVQKQREQSVELAADCARKQGPGDDLAHGRSALFARKTRKGNSGQLFRAMTSGCKFCCKIGDHQSR